MTVNNNRGNCNNGSQTPSPTSTLLTFTNPCCILCRDTDHGTTACPLLPALVRANNETRRARNTQRPSTAHPLNNGNCRLNDKDNQNKHSNNENRHTRSSSDRKTKISQTATPSMAQDKLEKEGPRAVPVIKQACSPQLHPAIAKIQVASLKPTLMELQKTSPAANTIASTDTDRPLDTSTTNVAFCARPTYKLRISWLSMTTP